MRRPIRLVLVASLMASSGLPLVILQTFAWARMAAGFLRHESLGCSLQKTFDGRHPCGMCRRLKEAAQPSQSLAVAAPYRSTSALPTRSSERALRPMALWTLASGWPRRYERVFDSDPPPPKTNPA